MIDEDLIVQLIEKYEDWLDCSDGSPLVEDTLDEILVDLKRVLR